MTAQEELQTIIADAKAWKWTPELFERIRRLLGYADVFNALRRELTPEEYDQFDLEYCSYYRPQDRETTKWLRKEQEKEYWTRKKQEAEQQRVKLLREEVKAWKKLERHVKQQSGL